MCFNWGTALALAGCVLLSSAHGPRAASFSEDFSSDPAARGWRVHGEGSLFRWNSTNQNLEVTWDSSKTNSFFYYPLPTVVGRDTDFSFGFDLTIADLASGTTPGKPFTFQLAIGLNRRATAFSPSFLRGTAMDSPNLVEWDYFPDSGYGATISPTFISSNQQFASGFNVIDLTTGAKYQTRMTYTASNQTLVTQMTRNGQPFGPIANVVVDTNFTDFRVDTFAIPSYSDAGQDTNWSGSVLAHGIVDNVVLTTPSAPGGDLATLWTNDQPQLRFTGASNWVFTIERTEDLATWEQEVVLPGIAGPMIHNPAPSPGKRFYRIQVNRP